MSTHTHNPAENPADPHNQGVHPQNSLNPAENITSPETIAQSLTLTTQELWARFIELVKQEVIPGFNYTTAESSTIHGGLEPITEWVSSTTTILGWRADFAPERVEKMDSICSEIRRVLDLAGFEVLLSVGKKLVVVKHRYSAVNDIVWDGVFQEGSELNWHLASVAQFINAVAEYYEPKHVSEGVTAMVRGLTGSEDE